MRWNVRTPVGTALFVLMAGMVGCGSDSPTETDPVDTAQIAVDDDFFNPGTATASAGETLTWGWRGGNPHNVTWDAADLPNSATQVSGSHNVTMPSAPGEYGYHCTVHGAPGAGMHGTVVVE